MEHPGETEENEQSRVESDEVAHQVERRMYKNGISDDADPGEHLEKWDEQRATAMLQFPAQASPEGAKQEPENEEINSLAGA